ncbi:hypothetical protein ABI59_02265 [Acidobacteria bacterium Mor1]|nr:hypothetical protein ABI59_02265 [Acidobacteria bacterium Mor1]
MSRQTRTLLILGCFALTAVVALGWMAERYAGMLPADADAAVEHVDAYLAANQAELEMGNVREGKPVSAAERHRLALEQAGIDPETYRRVASFARKWRRGEEIPPIYREAFEQRKDQLEPSRR